MKALVLALLSLAAMVPARADPLPIRIGYQAAADRFALLLAHRTDVALNLGQSYAVEVVPFQASSLEITQLAAGNIDVALLGYSSFGIALDGAKIDDPRVVFDGFRDGVDGIIRSSSRCGRTVPSAPSRI